MDEMSFYEGFEMMKCAQYVDMHERLMLREIAYLIIQKGNKKRVDITKLMPLPFDNNYVSWDERDYISEDFNTEWLKDYDKKMKDFKKKEEYMKEKIQEMKFETIDLKSFF